MHLKKIYKLVMHNVCTFTYLFTWNTRENLVRKYAEIRIL